MQRFTKDPAEQKDYLIDYSDLLDVGETISTSVWAADEGITIMTDGPHAASHTTTTATVWLSGGTERYGAYRVYNTITTNAGRTEVSYIYVEVREG